ncbi:hypothetical protein [Nereida sp. MMG025]|uniref:hypothetical protein n=1 Tax=Nereida sp. MMG025 TaxID=2909981 RepID=UPI001F15EC4D|nr:hypothetical protein [Nereida sp. MMG025]MCF6445510.1 hypothetical protein [Nereida sp. MMG025]
MTGTILPFCRKTKAQTARAALDQLYEYYTPAAAKADQMANLGKISADRKKPR